MSTLNPSEFHHSGRCEETTMTDLLDGESLFHDDDSTTDTNITHHFPHPIYEYAAS